MFHASHTGTAPRPRRGGERLGQGRFREPRPAEGLPDHGEPAAAIAFYLWQERENAYLPLTIDVLRISGGAITEILIFHNDQFPRLGLPERLLEAPNE